MILIDFGGQIKGDSKITGHADWISVNSFQFGVGRGVASSSGGADRDTSSPSISEVVFTKMMDVASTALFKESLIGKGEIETMTVKFFQVQGSDHQPYLELTFSNPIISGYSISSGGDRPSESISVNFTKLSTVYSQLQAGKTPKKGNEVKYDLATGAVS